MRDSITKFEIPEHDAVLPDEAATLDAIAEIQIQPAGGNLAPGERNGVSRHLRHLDVFKEHVQIRILRRIQRRDGPGHPYPPIGIHGALQRHFGRLRT